MLAKQKHLVNRLYLVVLALAALGVGIGYRVVHLQWIEGNKYAALSEKSTIKNFEILPERGNIYADDGSLLATSVPRYSIRFDAVTVSTKTFNANLHQLADSLSSLLGKKSSYYRNVLQNARKNNRRYQLIASSLNYSQYSRIRNFPIFRLGGIKGGLIVERKTVRDHPLKKIAERTIGYEKLSNNGTFIQVGLDGAFGTTLRGTPGFQLRQKIAQGEWKPLTNTYQQEPKNGHDIISTINVNIQDIAHHALLEALERFEAEHGSVVVMETQTGAVKAMVNLGVTTQKKYYEKLNYAIGESHEPGSTFKLMSLIAALEDKVVDTTTLIKTGNGKMTFYGKYTVRDAKIGGYGTIPVSEVFERSSNTGIVKIIHDHYKHNPKKFVDRLFNMGLNQPLGVPILGEGNPRIPHPSDDDWDGLDLPWMAYGYGVALTPLQILSFYNAIANDGEMIKPQFVTSIQNDRGQIIHVDKQIIRPAICSAETIQKVQKLMEGVVKHPWGTAHNIYDPTLSIAGKTGTCQVDYTKDQVQYVSSFVGYFPVEEPKYSCMVIIHRPNKSKGYYGNTVAAPVFKKIAEKIYTSRPLEIAITQRQILEMNSVSQTILKEVKQGVVPNVIGMALMDALPVLENKGLQVRIKGKGRVKKQSIPKGKKINQNQIIELILS